MRNQSATVVPRIAKNGVGGSTMRSALSPRAVELYVRSNGLIELAQYPSRSVLGQVGNPSHELFDAGTHHLATEVLLQGFVEAARDTLAEQPAAAQGREYKA